jgi:hypothetical protein
MTAKSTFNLKIIVSALFLMFVFSTSVFPQDVKDLIVKPYQDDLELCREALAELDRQAVQWLGQLHQWYGYFDSCAAANAAYTNTILSNLADSEAFLDSVVKAAADTEMRGAAWVPGYAFSTVEQFEQFRKDAKSEVSKDRAKVDAGDYRFGLSSLGDASRNAIQYRRKEHEEYIENVRTSIEEGTFYIFFPGLGQVTRVSLEARMASNHEAITNALANYYEQAKPDFGFESRQELEAAISSAQTQLRDLETEFETGQPRIFRHLFRDSAAPIEIENFIKNNESTLNELEESIAKGLFQTGFPGYDGVTENWLEDSIKTKQQYIQQLKKSVADGTYSVGIYPGWGTGDANYLHNAINNTNDADAIAIYRKALERIAIASNMDIEKLSMEVEQEKRYADLIKLLPVPDIYKLKLEIEQRKAMTAEWNRELDFQRKRLQRYIHYLEMLKPFYLNEQL